LVVGRSAASVLFSREGSDLTDDVIRAMDAQK
jgi:Skp family chaperone for outer membrane proteins